MILGSTTIQITKLYDFPCALFIRQLHGSYLNPFVEISILYVHILNIFHVRHNLESPFIFIWNPYTSPTCNHFLFNSIRFTSHIKTKIVIWLRNTSSSYLCSKYKHRGQSPYRNWQTLKFSILDFDHNVPYFYTWILNRKSFSEVVPEKVQHWTPKLMYFIS